VRVRDGIAKSNVGQTDVIEGVLICLVAGGHVLLEGVPGLGKTTLLRTLARVLDLRYSRIQFTPDLMPGDIVGSMIMESEEHGHKILRFQPGPIFANLVLADEINRATPKTQSALIEAMQERTVTRCTSTYALNPPFLVMATQNPIEMEGTYPLPEAQLDRFLMKILVGFLSREELNRLVDLITTQDDINLDQARDREQIAEGIDANHKRGLAALVARCAELRHFLGRRGLRRFEVVQLFLQGINLAADVVNLRMPGFAEPVQRSVAAQHAGSGRKLSPAGNCCSSSPRPVRRSMAIPRRIKLMSE